MRQTIGFGNQLDFRQSNVFDQTQRNGRFRASVVVENDQGPETCVLIDTGMEETRDETNGQQIRNVQMGKDLRPDFNWQSGQRTAMLPGQITFARCGHWVA